MLKMNVDSLEAVEEPFRPLYEQDGDRFKLKVDGVEDTGGLKNALSAERKRAADLEKQTKAWKALGKTPEEIAGLVEAAELKAQTEAERKGEWDKLRAQMNEKHQAELAEKDKSLSSMRSLIQSKVIDAQAVADIAAEGGVPDLLLPHVQRFVKTDENYSPIVIDASGTQRVDSKGNPMSIRDLVREMKASEVFGRAFNGSGQSGSGTQPANGGGGIPQIKTKADLYRGIAPTDKRAMDKARADFVMAHGPDAYIALPQR